VALRRVGVLISGRGSNLQALLDASRAGTLGGEVVAVVSNIPEARGLERARQAGVAAFVQDHRGRTRDEHDAAVQRILEESGVELVCLAGYMRLLSAGFVRRYPELILNVHPSLLPAFPGLDAQRQAWEHGAKVSGATVHFVDEALDAGPIVLQEAVDVRAEDTPATVAARILEAEHRIYPRAARIVLEGGYRREGRRIVIEEGQGP
jgi:phosphoribosylglycinamide formyltransferase-1